MNLCDASSCKIMKFESETGNVKNLRNDLTLIHLIFICTINDIINILLTEQIVHFLFIFWVNDANLFPNFGFDVCNNQTIVVRDAITLQLIGPNAFSHLFGFVTKASAIMEIELILGCR